MKKNRVSLNIDSAGAPGYRRGDKREKGKELFQVNHVQLEYVTGSFLFKF